MGLYMTNADVVSYLSSTLAAQLTTDTGATPDAAMIDRYIDRAEALVNQVVRKRTSVVITQADYPASYAMMQYTILPIVRAQLAERRPPVPEDWKAASEANMKWLTEFGAGKVDLPDTALNGLRAASSSLPNDVDRSNWP